jgi:outer membrane lipoprotein carrier protein
MLRFLLPCLVAAIMAMTPAFAGAASVGEVVTALEKGYDSLRDMQASFSQRSEMASVKRAQSGAGEVFIRKDKGAAMFRFNYTKPRQEIVSNGKTVWYYLPENRQVMTMDAASLFEGGGGVALSYLTGMGEVSRDFTARFVGNGQDGQGNYVLELVPKKGGQAFQKLHLTVSGRAVEEYLAKGRATVPFPIVSSVVFDQLGNRTTIVFSKVKANRGVKASLFTFNVPKGVEVIRNPMGGR